MRHFVALEKFIPVSVLAIEHYQQLPYELRPLENDHCFI
jgi:hypothetical protein